MNRILSRIVSFMIIFTLLLGPVPASRAAETETYCLSNGYIKVIVSTENGGFAILTEEGDKLNKDDNNKRLLYHDGEYDTSFTSFEVTYPDNTKKEYLFGGNYSFLGLGSDNLSTTRDATGVSSVWTVDNLTFTQRIELSNLGSAEHGMVFISYSVSDNKSRNVKVKARILLDTAFGDQDFAYYEVVDSSNVYRSINSETVIAANDYIPANFFAYDDPYIPSKTAYTVNSSTSMPYQVAFGHWNNLASTLFHFTPDSNLNFTNAYNKTYLTADSAYALYYDMGTVVAGGKGTSISTYYGVYSNEKTAGKDSVTVNLTAPNALELSKDKKSYMQIPGSIGNSTFSIQTQITNFVQDTAQHYDRVAIAVYAANGITPLDSFGKETGYPVSYSNPYNITYTDFKVGQTQTTKFYFKADVGSTASYRKIEIKVFSIPDSAGGALLKENILGSAGLYILCPGGDGELPKITFTGASPQILYNEGTRHLYVTGTNFNMLQDTSRYTLNLSGSNATYKIPSSQILFPEENVLDIILTDAMLPGDYEAVFEWTNPPEGIDKSLTAPALHVVITDNKAYKNDYYGIVAVVQEKGANKYYIKSYATESKFEADKKNYGEVLLVFRGEFTPEGKDDSGNIVKISATSLKSTDNNGNAVINNLITLNNCIDFENGTVMIYYDGIGNNRSVCVDFDGDLYTSGARSSIWSGYAALTELKYGTDYGLIPYNSDGSRLTDFIAKPITLIWPCALGLAQTIGGMIFNLTYGSLGIMYDDDNLTRVTSITPDTPVAGHILSFSAKLDLSFLVPGRPKTEGEKEWEKLQEYFNMEDQNGTKLRDRWNGLEFTSNLTDDSEDDDDDDDDDDKGKASAMVEDILYGCGKGYVGFNCTVDVQLPPYIEAMPVIKGKLSIATVGGWSLGVEGSCKFTKLEVEVELGLKSYKGYPIPDKLYFYIGGFEPGINVDGFGVLWITGGGGGFDNLYDTIFASDGIPPLKLLISVSFDIIKVLSARADLSLSLRGLGLKVGDVKIKFTDIVVLKRAQLQFDWYPEFYFMTSVTANILDVISGSGYIVVINNEQYKGFVEFFIRAGVMVPKKVPILGGITLAQIDLGVNNEKIWGVLRALCVDLGITYYWGGSVEFGVGDGAKPTFPSLLGYDDVPVYYDEETGQTLYLHIGTNLSVAAKAEIVEKFDNVMHLMGVGDPFVQSNADQTLHKLNPGEYKGENAAFTISFSAYSLDQAKALADLITIKDNTNTPYNLSLYDGTNAATANANLTYDENYKKANLAVTITRPEHFDKDWDITTPPGSDIVLYAIASVPMLNSVSGSLSGETVKVNWDGSELDKLDSISFYLTTDNGSSDSITDMGTCLGSISETAAIQGKSANFSIPKGLSSGNYYMRAIYSKEDVVNSSITSTKTISYTNIYQPAEPTGVSIVNGGDLTFNVLVGSNGNTDYDGYLLNVYEHNEISDEFVLTNFNNMTRNKQKDDKGKLFMPNISVGGSYDGLDETGQPVKYGLEAGKRYRIGVTAYKNIYATDGTTILYRVLSKEVLSNAAVLKDCTPPTINVESIIPFKMIRRAEWGTDSNGKAARVTVDHETYATGDVSFSINADTNITGTLSLNNDAMTGEFTDTNSMNLVLKGLTDGDHTLVLRGKDVDGDSFRTIKTFSVDTLPPRLMLTSPTNGSFFEEDGSLTISGVSDSDALFTIVEDGITLYSQKTIAEFGGTIDSRGVFSFDCRIDPGKSSHDLLITVADEMGNLSKVICSVQNKGLANVTGIDIYVDGVTYSNKNIKLRTAGSTSALLTLVARTAANNEFIINDNRLVHWMTTAVEGTASIDEEGKLTIGNGSIGYVTGSYRVADHTSMTAAATFGAEVYSGDSERYHLTVGTTIGGTATGQGYYSAGAIIPVTAIPKPGYRFVGWTSTDGGPFANPASEATTYTMPAGNAVITAHFEIIDTGRETGTTATARSAGAGELVIMDLPDNADEYMFVPYYIRNGVKVKVLMSAVLDGKLIFIAPINAVYYFMNDAKSFHDIDRHWADHSILFAATRGLFNGTGNNRFEPDKTMTRAMFVTVLGRLDGVDISAYGTGSFKDTDSKSWYSAYVEWASKNMIITGYGNELFGPDDAITREQMCVIFLRYLNYKGFILQNIHPKISFKDQDRISSWALDAVSICQQSGLILGKGNNLFDPKANATRAEVSTVFYRLICLILESMK